MGTTAKQDKDFVDQIIIGSALEIAMDWIAGNFSPEDVFSEGALQTWAESNGWVRDEK